MRSEFPCSLFGMNTKLTDEGIDTPTCKAFSMIPVYFELTDEGIDTQNHITKRCKCLLM